jgi:hypothetical protein
MMLSADRRPHHIRALDGAGRRHAIQDQSAFLRLQDALDTSARGLAYVGKCQSHLPNHDAPPAWMSAVNSKITPR